MFIYFISILEQFFIIFFVKIVNGPPLQRIYLYQYFFKMVLFNKIKQYAYLTILIF